MQRKTLSVVLCNYNDSRYLSETLRRLLTQGEWPDEVIVVDDGSTDNSVEIIEQMREQFPRIKLIRHFQNKGVNAAIATGAKAASGDYIYFASANDKVLDGFFSTTMQLLSNYPDVGLCCAEATLFVTGADGKEEDFYKHDPFVWKWGRKPRCFSPQEAVAAIRKKHIFTPTTILRRKAFLEEGGHNDRLTHRADTFLVNVLALRYGFCYVPELFVKFRYEKDSFSGKLSRDKEKTKALAKELLYITNDEAHKDIAESFIKAGRLTDLGKNAFALMISDFRVMSFSRWLTVTRQVLFLTIQFKLRRFLDRLRGQKY